MLKSAIKRLLNIPKATAVFLIKKMTGIQPEIRRNSAGFRRNTKKFRRKIFPESGGFPGEFYRIPPEFRRSCHVRFLAGKSFFKGEKSI